MKDRWNKIKNFGGLRDLSIIGFAQIIGGVISAVFWFYLAAIVTQNEYGQISYLIAIAGIVSAISMLGGAGTITVYVAKKIKVQPAIFFITLIVASGLALIIGFILNEISVTIFVIGYVIFNLAIADLLGRKLYKSYARYFIIQKILLVGFSLGLYYVMGPSGVVLGFAFSFLPLSIRIYKNFREAKIDFTLLRSRLGFMFNNFSADLSRALSGHLDRIIIAPIFGFVLLGNYHLSLQFLSLLSLLPTIVIQYILPQESSGSPHLKLKKITILASIFLAILGILLLPVLLPIFFPKYQEAIHIVQIASVAIVPRTISIMYQSKFLASEKSRYVLIGTIILITVQIGFIFILSSIFGINGVAGALVLGEGSQAVFLYIANRSVFMPHQNRKQL